VINIKHVKHLQAIGQRKHPPRHLITHKARCSLAVWGRAASPIMDRFGQFPPYFTTH